MSADVAGCHVSCKGKCCTSETNEARKNSFAELEIEEGIDDEAEVYGYPEQSKKVQEIG